MAKKLNKKIIKIPAFITCPVSGESVCKHYNDMISNMKNIIEDYNNSSVKYEKNFRGKNIIKEIQNINYEVYQDGERQILVLKVQDSKRGFTDLNAAGVKMNDSDNISSSYNCAVLYPIIEDKNNKIINYWLIFVYVDPGKIDNDVISTIKASLVSILGLKIQHMKPKMAIEALAKEQQVNLSASFTSVVNRGRTFDIGGRLIKTIVKKTDTIEYEAVPSDDVKKVLNMEIEEDCEEQKITIEMKNGRQIRYKRNGEYTTNFTQAIEQSYNYECIISSDELDNMYETAFICSKVKEAVIQFGIQ